IPTWLAYSGYLALSAVAVTVPCPIGEAVGMPSFAYLDMIHHIRAMLAVAKILHHRFIQTIFQRQLTLFQILHEWLANHVYIYASCFQFGMGAHVKPLFDIIDDYIDYQLRRIQ
ncbi:hypothetical protein ACJX0J_011482, partial [Zea mays]